MYGSIRGFPYCAQMVRIRGRHTTTSPANIVGVWTNLTCIPTNAVDDDLLPRQSVCHIHPKYTSDALKTLVIEY